MRMHNLEDLRTFDQLVEILEIRGLIIPSNSESVFLP